MTFEERLDALTPLGLTPRQTRFVALVALHSGYCVRRQYVTYAGVRYGKNVREFLDGLVVRGLALRFMLRADRGHVYHLRARAIYRALRQEENRNRRVASSALIARKLMLLDVVLGEPDADWLATEEDKVQSFVTRFGVPASELPHRVFAPGEHGSPPATRYFLDKLPIYVPPDSQVPHFVYLAADGSVLAFERFLRERAPLFARLPEWAVVCVLPKSGQVGTVYQATFDRFQLGTPAGSMGDQLSRYFALRRTVEGGNFQDLSVAELHDYRSMQRRFASRDIERLFAAWRGFESPRTAAPATGFGRLLIRTLSHPYQQFGTLAGVG